jgi:hypothetical protein
MIDKTYIIHTYPKALRHCWLVVYFQGNFYHLNDKKKEAA